MKTVFYLVECINGGEFNIYEGSESECIAEMQRINDCMGDNANAMYISSNRFN